MATTVDTYRLKPWIQLPLQVIDKALGVTAANFQCAGFDLADAPSDAVMKSWWAVSPYWFVGYYLPGAPRLLAAAGSWRGRREKLAAQGWGFAVWYVGLQIGDAGADAKSGSLHGTSAAATADAETFRDKGTVLYFDVESKGTDVVPQAYLDYLTAWAKAVASKGYTPGFYCPPQYAQQIDQAVQPGCSVGPFYFIANYSFAKIDPPKANGVTADFSRPIAEAFHVVPRVGKPFDYVPGPSLLSRVRGWQGTEDFHESHAGQSLRLDHDIATLPDPSSPPA